MEKSTKIKSRRDSVRPLTKLGIVVILAAGLINISTYMSTYASTIPAERGRVILGDSPEFMKHENLAPTVQPWENGIRTSPTLGTFEW